MAEQPTPSAAVPPGPASPQPATTLPQYQPAPGYPMAARRPTNQLAIVSLAAGIASFVIVPLIGAIVAVVTGHMARRQIRQTGEEGNGLALAGLILGYVHLALFALVIVLVLIFAVGMIGILAAANHQ